jgi:hypothetical protein
MLEGNDRAMTPPPALQEAASVQSAVLLRLRHPSSFAPFARAGNLQPSASESSDSYAHRRALKVRGTALTYPRRRTDDSCAALIDRSESRYGFISAGTQISEGFFTSSVSDPS